MRDKKATPKKAAAKKAAPKKAATKKAATKKTASKKTVATRKAAGAVKKGSNKATAKKAGRVSKMTAELTPEELKEMDDYFSGWAEAFRAHVTEYEAGQAKAAKKKKPGKS